MIEECTQRGDIHEHVAHTHTHTQSYQFESLHSDVIPTPSYPSPLKTVWHYRVQASDTSLHHPAHSTSLILPSLHQAYPPKIFQLIHSFFDVFGTTYKYLSSLKQQLLHLPFSIFCEQTFLFKYRSEILNGYRQDLRVPEP